MKLPSEENGSTTTETEATTAECVAVHRGRRSTGRRFSPAPSIPAAQTLRRTLPCSTPADPGVPVDDLTFPIHVRLASRDEYEGLAGIIALLAVTARARGGAR